MTDKTFKLSNSFKTLFSTSKQKQHPKAVFKLNPNSSNPLNDIPVEMLRKKSRTKLQSLKDQANTKKFSILNQKPEDHIKDLTETKKKNQPKKYNLQMDNKKKSKEDEAMINETDAVQLPNDYVRPSQIMKSEKINEPGYATLIQTPILPCFASQFAQNLHQSEFKEVKEKEGVWKIGKMKVKGKKAQLNINGFTFQANLAEIQGKAGCVNENNFFQLPDWQGIWVAQPHQTLFS